MNSDFITHTQNACRISCYDRKHGNIFRNHCPGTNDGIITYSDLTNYNGRGTNINIVADNWRADVVANILRSNRCALAKRYMISDTYTTIDNQTKSVKDSCTRPYLATPMHFRTCYAFCNKSVYNDAYKGEWLNINRGSQVTMRQAV